jgi:hypothetical protein
MLVGILPKERGLRRIEIWMVVAVRSRVSATVSNIARRIPSKRMRVGGQGGALPVVVHVGIVTSLASREVHRGLLHHAAAIVYAVARGGVGVPDCGVRSTDSSAMAASSPVVIVDVAIIVIGVLRMLLSAIVVAAVVRHL